MKSFPVAALVAGACLLALSQTAVGQTGAPIPQARPAAQTTSVQPTQSRPLQRRAADVRFARVQAWRAPVSCSSLGCRRMILLGIAY